MSEKRDLRVEKTYEALFGALRGLLTRKPYGDITVKELCDAARIRTATFYKHFGDKNDFFLFMTQELYDQYFEQYGGQTAETTEQYCERLFRSGLGFLESNLDLIGAIRSDSTMSIITQATGNAMREELLRRLSQDEHDGRNLVSSPQITAELIIGAITQISRWWLEHRSLIAPDELSQELTEYVHRVIGGDLR